MSENKISKIMVIIYILVSACLIGVVGVFFNNGSKNGNAITVDGFMGPLTVEVTIENGVIKDAKVTKSTEGEFLPQSEEIIFNQAIEKGNANSIDIVAGATFTSKALISSLQQAYIKAKTDETSIVGYGEGYIGPLSVIITTEDDAIVSAELLTISDSEFSLATAEALLEQAVANGNADNLDVIAGATATSKALITAMQEAQVAAGIGENVYTATADGRAGPISIAVTIIDGKITGAIVTDYPTGERIPESADTIIAKAIENGHPNEIDVVAGASMTSRGLISALQLAYTEATNE